MASPKASRLPQFVIRLRFPSGHWETFWCLNENHLEVVKEEISRTVLQGTVEWQVFRLGPISVMEHQHA